MSDDRTKVRNMLCMRKISNPMIWISCRKRIALRVEIRYMSSNLRYFFANFRKISFHLNTKQLCPVCKLKTSNLTSTLIN